MLNFRNLPSPLSWCLARRKRNKLLTLAKRNMLDFEFSDPEVRKVVGAWQEPYDSQ